MTERSDGWNTHVPPRAGIWSPIDSMSAHLRDGVTENAERPLRNLGWSGLVATQIRTVEVLCAAVCGTFDAARKHDGGSP